MGLGLGSGSGLGLGSESGFGFGLGLGFGFGFGLGLVPEVRWPVVHHTVRGTHRTPEAGTRTPYVQCVAPRGKPPCASGAYGTQEAGARTSTRGVRVSTGGRCGRLRPARQAVRTYSTVQPARTVQRPKGVRVSIGGCCGRLRPSCPMPLVRTARAARTHSTEAPGRTCQHT